MNALGRQLRWLITIRLVVITSVGLPYFLLQLSRPNPEVSPYDALYLLAGATYLVSLGYIAMLRLPAGYEKAQAYVQFIGDLLLITGLVYTFGGIASPFSMLYLIVIAVASAMLRRGAGTTVATTAYALYAFTLVGLYLHWFPGAQVEATEANSIWRLTYNLAVHLFGFYAVALLTSYLAQNVSQAEHALKQRSDSLADLEVVHHDIIQSISSGLVTTDLDGIVTSVNRTGTEILGRSEGALVGLPISATGLLSEGAWATSTEQMRAQGKARVEVDSQIAGQERHIGFSLTQLSDAGGVVRGHILIFTDLTEWRQLQENLRLKDRMAAVGQLAAGLAHEIGNPLAAISGSVQMLAGNFPEDSSNRRLLDILLKESQRLDRTIKGFLRFARPRDRQPARVEVNRLLAENVSLLRNSEEVGARHRIELEVGVGESHLSADPDQVSQIFWNLARNALRAMPEGGCLRISGRPWASSYRIEFTDTGRGMSEHQRENLFHPFQSFFDGGMGIGMAIVYQIVQEHNGWIEVQSRPGEGTTVSVHLPADEEPASGLAAISGSEPQESSNGRAPDPFRQPVPGARL
jgi:two-component system sensor histidine kinase PilS (NtrC family)